MPLAIVINDNGIVGLLVVVLIVLAIVYLIRRV